MLVQWAGLAEVAALPKEYYTSLEWAANELQIPKEWLHKLIKIESSYRLTVINKWGYAGIGQWSNANAQILGFSSGASLVAACPTWTTQMPIMVKWIKYLWKTYGKIKTPGFLYLCHILPANAKYYNDKSHVLRSKNGIAIKGNKLYDRNTIWDANGDGKVTVGDIDALFGRSVETIPETQKTLEGGSWKDDGVVRLVKEGIESTVSTLVPLLLIFGIGSFLFSNLSQQDEKL